MIKSPDVYLLLCKNNYAKLALWNIFLASCSGCVELFTQTNWRHAEMCSYKVLNGKLHLQIRKDTYMYVSLSPESLSQFHVSFCSANCQTFIQFTGILSDLDFWVCSVLLYFIFETVSCGPDAAAGGQRLQEHSTLRGQHLQEGNGKLSATVLFLSCSEYRQDISVL